MKHDRRRKAVVHLVVAFIMVMLSVQIVSAQTNTFPPSGNAGVGTTTPTLQSGATNTMVEVKGSVNPGVGLTSTAAGGRQYFVYSAQTNPGYFSIFDATAGADRLVINNLGNVGIGTASPDRRLTVQGDIPLGGGLTVIRTTGVNHAFGLQLDATGTGNNNLGFLRAGVTKSTLAWDNSRNFMGFANFMYSGTDFAMRLNSDGSFTYNDGSSGAERFRITASGNVGVGTNTPSAKLGVTTATANDGIILNGNSNWALLATNLGLGSYNNMTKAGDRGIIYGGTSLGNPGGGFVIAPWASANSGMRLDASGNVTVGGSINATGAITGATINATYQDVAEWVDSSQRLAAGTVVVLDQTKSNQVVASTQTYDSRVAGVISLRPGLTLGEAGADRVLVATTGRVKIKVSAANGPINIGDLLVTSNEEGVAMKSLPINVGGVQIHRPGTLIGKALEPLAKGRGTILVLLSLQ